MTCYLVCYVIADPNRLRRVAHIGQDFGSRRQLSVFLVRVSATDMVRLRTRLYDAINLTEDQVLFVPVCGKCVAGIEAIGRPTPEAAANDVVVVI